MAIVQGYGYNVGSAVFGGIDMLNLPLFPGYNENKLIAADAEQLVYESGTAEDTFELVSGSLLYDSNDQLLGSSMITGISETGFVLNTFVEISGFSITWDEVQDLGTYGFLKQVLSGNDSITGQRTGQIAHANDRLLGFGGHDTIHGGDGNDRLSGMAGNDALYGETGFDVIYGGGGRDTLDGGGGGSADALFGGAGNDVYVVDSGSLGQNNYDRIVETPGGGVDTVLATVVFSLPFALAANVENLTIVAGATTTSTVVAGNDSANRITGSLQADKISGLGGADSINGGVGDDSLDGGSGRDTLTGGTGTDHYVFSTGLALTNIDRLADFEAPDKIVLDDDVFTALSSVSPALAAEAFNSGVSATDSDDRILYDSPTGAVYYDADGVGGVAAVQFATLANLATLTAADFVIVD